MPSASLPPTPARPSPATGLAALDEEDGLLAPGTLTVVAGRPGHGAGAVLTQILCHTALDRNVPAVRLHGGSVCMDAFVQIAMARAAIPRPRLLMEDLNPIEQVRLDRLLEDLARSPLYDVEVEPATVEGLDTLLREAVRSEAPPALVAIESVPFWGNPEQGLAELIRHLRCLATELGVAVVATTGVRQWHARPNGLPKLADVHDERLIRAHATTVILTDHPATRTPQSGRSLHDLDLYLHPIAGDREPRQVTVGYDRQCGRVMDPAPIR